jgi:hypothetical protein
VRPMGKGHHPICKSCSGSKDMSLSSAHGFQGVNFKLID